MRGGQEAIRGQTGLSIARVLADYWREHVAKKIVSKQTAAYAVKHLAEHFCGFHAAKEFNVKDMTAYIDLLSIWPKGMVVTEIDPADVERYVRKRAVGKIGQRAGDTTIRRELGGTFTPAINHAIRMRRMKATEAPYIPLPEDGEGSDRWLTEEEAAKLYAAAQPPGANRLTRAYRFIALGLNTAARKGALEGLTWFQVDFERRRIRLNPKGRKQTKKKRPTVPISDDLLPILKRAKEEAIGEYVLDHPGSIRKTFETAVAKAGLDDVTPHVLRHTWATWAAQHGTDLWDIAGMLGDKMDTVIDHYAHHHPDHLRDAANFRRAKRDETEEVEEG